MTRIPWETIKRIRVNLKLLEQLQVVRSGLYGIPNPVVNEQILLTVIQHLDRDGTHTPEFVQSLVSLLRRPGASF